jgi:hypothetical protein
MNKKFILPFVILLLSFQIGFSATGCDLYVITDRGVVVFLESTLHFIMNLLMCWSGMYVLLFFIAIAGILMMIFKAFGKW